MTDVTEVATSEHGVLWREQNKPLKIAISIHEIIANGSSTVVSAQQEIPSTRFQMKVVFQNDFGDCIRHGEKGSPSLDFGNNILQYRRYARNHSRKALVRFPTGNPKEGHISRCFDGSLDILESKLVGPIGATARVIHRNSRDHDTIQKAHEVFVFIL